MYFTSLVAIFLISLFQIYEGKIAVKSIQNRVSDPGQFNDMFADFSIGDLTDDPTLMLDQLDHLKFNDSSETDEIGNDIPGFALDPEDYLTGEDISEGDDRLQSPMYENYANDPITNSFHFEGDIKNVDVSEIRAMYDDAVKDQTYMRNAIKDKWRKWPGGVVPYVISSRYNRYERGIIAKAMQEYKTKTCIRFVPRTNQRAYIHIVKGSGCSSSVGRTGNVQSVSLGNGCVYPGIVIHELMHAIGFWHEQSRNDRDSHVKINTHNIQRGMEYNFLKYSLYKIDHLKAAYDTCSVMHYGAYAFSRNRQPTISKTSSRDKCELGQRNGFSKIDLEKINRLYECEGTGNTGGGGGGSVVTTETPVKPDMTCRDTHKYCADWAKAGECKSNPAWMLKGCPVACDECENECADHNSHCSSWKARGECKKNAPYMNIYCAKSCEVCNTTGKQCKDEGKDCKYWATQRYCKDPRYKNYMKLRCKKSCKLCTP